MKAIITATGVLLTAALSIPVLAADSYQGCYTPLYGFAKSLCNDASICESQTGLYRIVLRNADAPAGKRRLVMSGMFQGLNISAAPSEIPECNALTQTSHLLMDKNMAGSIETGPDSVCMTGGGDFVTTIDVSETLTVSSGVGIYANVKPGGTVTMSGTISLKTGINSFKVTPQPEDMICFGD